MALDPTTSTSPSASNNTSTNTTSKPSSSPMEGSHEGRSKDFPSLPIPAALESSTSNSSSNSSSSSRPATPVAAAAAPTTITANTFTSGSARMRKEGSSSDNITLLDGQLSNGTTTTTLRKSKSHGRNVRDLDKAVHQPSSPTTLANQGLAEILPPPSLPLKMAPPSMASEIGPSTTEGGKAKKEGQRRRKEKEQEEVVISQEMTTTLRRGCQDKGDSSNSQQQHHQHQHARRGHGRRARAAAAAATKVLQSGYFYMALLALQFGCQPMLARRYISRASPKMPVVMVTESVKVVLCLAFLACEKQSERIKLWKTWSLQESLRVGALPAALYALQNVLAQLGYQHLDSLTFNLLNQTKTISAAFCLYIFLGKHQTPLQVVALTLLLAASMILNWPSNNTSHSSSSSSCNAAAAASNFYLGVLPVLGASFLSGLSAALTQKTLQGLSRNSYMYSMELAVYGQICLAVSLLIKAYGPTLLALVGWGEVADASSTTASLPIHSEGGVITALFTGWTSWTMLPVILNAGGGIIVGLVTKYAGGVSKGFSLIAGILLTAFIQAVVQARPPPPLHWVAAVLVALSTYMHSVYRPKPPKATHHLSPQMTIVRSPGRRRKNEL